MLEKLKELYESKVPSFLQNKWGLLVLVVGLAFAFWLVAKSWFLLKLAFWGAIVYAIYQGYVYIKESLDKHDKG